MPEAPIGVFDSGFGGLSVLAAIRAVLPAEDLVYCADHAHLPYGERDAEAIRGRAHALADALAAAGCKAVVIACNTATAAAADALRARLDIPVVGMEPAIKPAAAATRSGVIGVLGTGGTLASARFAALLERYAGRRRVITRPCPELVAAVEQRRADPGRTRALVAAAVEPLLAEGADVLVLGCTHFPFLRAEIESVAGPGVTVIDTGPAVARELVRRLEAAGARRPGTRRGRERFWTTGDPAALRATLSGLWGAAELEPCPAPRPRAQGAR
ncbi:MAG: glutamate racemase [Halofilum sp. (in: g-proteobacteria)]|nr:glutamate racemase [Halofilum sp. (in: g-proteobacteria)]